MERGCAMIIESFASVKDSSQNVRDNNAAWVAGPSRICFYIVFTTALLHPHNHYGMLCALNDCYFL
jgi:hypothetical protein